MTDRQVLQATEEQMEASKFSKSIYKLNELKNVGDMILLDETDNLQSVRSVVSNYKRRHNFKGVMKVVKDHVNNRHMIIRLS